MANRSGVENEEYAEFGQEYGILGRKREETLAWNLALRMADDSDDSAFSQPSKADFKKFWYQAQAPAADQNPETEDDDTQPLRRQRNPKRRCSAR